MRALPAVALAVLLAGCGSPGAGDGSSTGPGASAGTSSAGLGTGTSTGPWSSASSSSYGSHEPFPDWPWNGTWIAMAEECGYCPAKYPATITLVDADGQVLVVKVRTGERAGAGVDFVNGTSPWRDAVAQPVLDLHGGGVEVFEVHNRTVAAGDWERLAQAIRDGLATARDPQPKGGPMVADGGYRILLAEGRRAVLDENHDGGGGWAEVAEAMDEIRGGQPA